MINHSWKLFFLLIISVVVPVGFQNCSPAFKSASTEGMSSLSSMSVLSCGPQISGSRWWEQDPALESLTCGENIVPLRYYVEKTCSNGTEFVTGQRVADSSNPICQISCQSTTQPWTVAEGHMAIADICAGNIPVNAIYERKVQYTCVNGTPTATGQVQPGTKLAGGCQSNYDPPTCHDTSSQPQAEGMVWQERTSALTYNESCTGGQRQVSCERYFEYHCSGGVKHLTSRAVVSMNCSSTSQCTSSASCTSNGKTYAHLATWSERIQPDFVDAGTCVNGGDLMITSKRMQTYQCNNGSVVAQQVVRGANVSQIGQCGPKSCSMANGTGQQKWVNVSGAAQWGACEAASCLAGYVIENGVCVADKRIQIITANYGDNYGLSGNATDHMSQVCNGKRTCAYYISTDNLGDPVFGGSKDFKVYYSCGDGIERQGYATYEANTRTVSIGCQ